MRENWLLSALAPACQDFLAQRIMIKPIHSGEVLYESGAPLQSLIFPLDGLVSLRSGFADGRYVENIAIGRDGVLGAKFLLGETRLNSQAVTVVSGRAAWVMLSDFQNAMERFPCVHPAVSTWLGREIRRLMQAVACASLHPAAQRISSWLLHADDRVSGQHFDLTQRTIAETLGLRQATVSESCSSLLAQGAIHYSRGNLSILDRHILEQEACECYSAVALDCLPQQCDV